MASEQDREINQAAWERLRSKIYETYPKGRFVAIGRGSILADTESFETMLERLQQLGWNSRDTMVVKVGHEPCGNILSTWLFERR